MPALKQSQRERKSAKTAVEVFNGSSSKLAKLGGLIDYVGERIEASDFIVVLESVGSEQSVVPAQFEVIRAFTR